MMYHWLRVCLLFLFLSSSVAWGSKTVSISHHSRQVLRSLSGGHSITPDDGNASPNNIHKTTATPIPMLSTADMQSPSSSSSKKTAPLRSFLRIFTHTESVFALLLANFFEDVDLLRAVSKSCSFAFWSFLGLSVLGTIGVDTKPILSLISVIGVTLGFAAKDLIGSIFSGLFLILTKPFERGSIIKVNGFRGRVLSMDFRYVRLKGLEGDNEIVLPISSIANSPIVVEQAP